MIRKLTIEDISRVLELQEFTLKNISKHICFYSEKEDILKSLSHDCSYGFFVSDSLISCAIIKKGISHYLKDFVSFRDIITYDIALTHPSHKGKGYQDKLMKEVLKEYKEFNIIATVSSSNQASLNLFKRNNFRIEGELLRKGSYRNIMLKEKYE